MSAFKEIVAAIAYGIEAFGVLVILIGCAFATVRLLGALKKSPGRDLYQNYRLLVGRSILLGLEFLIAGDVVRTVVVSHTLSDVGVLGLLVLVRAFLSLTLTVEIEGKLPWVKEKGTVPK